MHLFIFWLNFENSHLHLHVLIVSESLLCWWRLSRRAKLVAPKLTTTFLNLSQINFAQCFPLQTYTYECITCICTNFEVCRTMPYMTNCFDSSLATWAYTPYISVGFLSPNNQIRCHSKIWESRILGMRHTHFLATHDQRQIERISRSKKVEVPSWIALPKVSMNWSADNFEEMKSVGSLLQKQKEINY